MDLWNVRNQALAALDSDLKQESEVLEEGFALLDKCIDRLHASAIIENDHTAFADVCCQTLVKARRLALGCYSLCLDGLILEAGALMRILKEAWQLLIYFYQDPTRIELAVAEKLPKPGEIAKAINIELHNYLKGLTDYYNATTAHISFREDALVPMDIVFNSELLKENMRSLFSIIGHLLYNAGGPCLVFLGKMDKVLAKEIDSFRDAGVKVFCIDEQM